jgi:hypothetical protein
MKIKIIRTTVADGQVVRSGNVYDVPNSEAKALILLGKAVAADDVVHEVEVQEPAETVSPLIETETPKRRSKNRKG